ncbi:hypothetical protein [Methylocystis bryophila]|uniref:Uncharacterized protein n=1 Tax=Methylocystis bryophila TaxID=655015 RepID=A0A1W6MZ23_9HYPH|nr:hypothetical protein [Methylocystis bryophila]ARN82825.1 hypothetical protein B1812_18950 [Methylocystis bryophila]BDV39080.1 hypothetical protein DSM21852_23330 [Methylocystis bryophila]
MRHPFFNLTHLVLRRGESDFALQEAAQGVVVTLGPDTAVFARPGATVSRWPGAKILARQTPHPTPRRGWLARELDTFKRVAFGGGDVKLSMIKTLGKQRETLLSAGDGAVAEKLDLNEYAREGAPPLLLLQPSYLCSGAEISMASAACDASTMSWARALYVYRAEPPQDLSRPAILCLSGRTLVWSERLEPGDSRDFALGNVIAATLNVSSRLRPTSQCHPDDFRAEIVGENRADTAQEAEPTRGLWPSARILLESLRAREGFFVCEMTNYSRSPAFVFIQLNRSNLYGGSGLVGLAIRLLGAFFRLSHLTFGN